MPWCFEPVIDQRSGAFASIEIREDNEWYAFRGTVPAVNGSAEIAKSPSPVRNANGVTIDRVQYPEEGDLAEFVLGSEVDWNRSHSKSKVELSEIGGRRSG